MFVIKIALVIFYVYVYAVSLARNQCLFTEIFLFSSVKYFGPCWMFPYCCWLRRGLITVQASGFHKFRSTTGLS